MKKAYNKKDKVDTLPFYVIKLATQGDVEAINIILKHYERYIIRLSTRELYDQYGNVHFCVDETLRRRLETKLITKIISFKIEK